MICELPFLGISVLPFELQQSVDTRDDGKEKHQSCVTSAYHYRLFCSNEIKAFCYVGRVWDLEWWFCARVRVCIFFLTLMKCTINLVSLSKERKPHEGDKENRDF